jgi:hypothetical protein
MKQKCGQDYVDQLLLIIASLSLIGLTVIWIVRPLLQGTQTSRERTPEARAVAELSAQHAIILKSLRDLDGDYAAGKMAQDDYTAQRASTLAEGVAVLQRLDSLKERLAQTDPALDQAIEEAVAARRALPDAMPERKPVCQGCGSVVRLGARFCDQCGAPLTAPTLTPAPGAEGGA